jgi:hypothetical protein
MSHSLLGAIPPKTKPTQQNAGLQQLASESWEEKLPKQMSSLAEYRRLVIRFRPFLL